MGSVGVVGNDRVAERDLVWRSCGNTPTAITRAVLRDRSVSQRDLTGVVERTAGHGSVTAQGAVDDLEDACIGDTTSLTENVVEEVGRIAGYGSATDTGVTTVGQAAAMGSGIVAQHALDQDESAGITDPAVARPLHSVVYTRPSILADRTAFDDQHSGVVDAAHILARVRADGSMLQENPALLVIDNAAIDLSIVGARTSSGIAMDQALSNGQGAGVRDPPCFEQTAVANDLGLMDLEGALVEDAAASPDRVILSDAAMGEHECTGIVNASSVDGDVRANRCMSESDCAARGDHHAASRRSSSATG